MADLIFYNCHNLPGAAEPGRGMTAYSVVPGNRNWEIETSDWIYCALESRWLGGRKTCGTGLFYRKYRPLLEETGWLGADYISKCLETRWLGQNCGFYFRHDSFGSIYYDSRTRRGEERLPCRWRRQRQEASLLVGGSGTQRHGTNARTDARTRQSRTNGSGRRMTDRVQQYHVAFLNYGGRATTVTHFCSSCISMRRICFVCICICVCICNNSSLSSVFSLPFSSLSVTSIVHVFS